LVKENIQAQEKGGPRMDESAAAANAAILERLERIVDSLQDNSIKMGQLLAVHNEKLDKQDKIDAVLFEKVESVHREVNRRADEIKKGCEIDIKLSTEYNRARKVVPL
jgi:hypothetical protein